MFAQMWKNYILDKIETDVEKHCAQIPSDRSSVSGGRNTGKLA